jgi:hypothetical protein
MAALGMVSGVLRGAEARPYRFAAGAFGELSDVNKVDVEPSESSAKKYATTSPSSTFDPRALSSTSSVASKGRSHVEIIYRLNTRDVLPDLLRTVTILLRPSASIIRPAPESRTSASA